MTGPWLLSALSDLAVAVFVVGVVLRTLKYARAPLHLRWELYPVPHEKGKGSYGGSYFEEPDWWTHPRQTSLGAEISAMLEEMLLIRSLWHRNRAQWYASFPFHMGLYLLAAFLFFLLVEAVAGQGSGVATALQPVTLLLGVAGLASGTAGAAGLLWRRSTNRELVDSSGFVDYFNLGLLLALFLSAAYAWLTVDSSFSLLASYLRGLLTLAPASVGPAVAAEVILASLFLIYLPFSHMTHFVAKYFTYHQVRWDDTPNRGDPRMMARMQANLARPVGWSAPHIQSEKSWAEAATEVR